MKCLKYSMCQKIDRNDFDNEIELRDMKKPQAESRCLHYDS